MAYLEVDPTAASLLAPLLALAVRLCVQPSHADSTVWVLVALVEHLALRGLQEPASFLAYPAVAGYALFWTDSPASDRLAHAFLSVVVHCGFLAAPSLPLLASLLALQAAIYLLVVTGLRRRWALVCFALAGGVAVGVPYAWARTLCDAFALTLALALTPTRLPPPDELSDAVRRAIELEDLGPPSDGDDDSTSEFEC